MELDEYLVSLMEKHPNLYNKRDEFYKDTKRKRESWDAIAKALNLDGIHFFITNIILLALISWKNTLISRLLQVIRFLFRTSFLDLIQSTVLVVY